MSRYHCLIFNIGMTPDHRGYGIYKIADHLRKNNWDAEVIDFTVAWSLEELKELSKSRITSNTKFIGFGHLFIHWTETLELFCAWLKETYPHLKFIAGSQGFPTHDTECIDYHILGNGEHALIALLKYLFSNGVPVLTTKFPWSNRTLIIANNVHSPYSAGYTTDLATRYEDRDFIEPTEWLTMEFSRGCKFACKFCDFPYLRAKGNYLVDQENFLTQMNDNYERFGVKNYITADSTFNDTSDKIRMYADAVETLNFVPFFSGFIRCDLLISRPQDKEELLRMNYLGHSYGIETLNHAAGKSIAKGMHPDKVKDGIYDIHKYFTTHGRNLYSATLTLIEGLPHETKETITSTIDWVNNLPPEITGFFTPLMISRQNYGIASDIEKNWKSYGYKEFVSLDNIESDLDSSRDLICWENEHMNYLEAREYARLVNRSKKGYIDSWTIPSLLLHGKEVEERLKYDFNYVNTEEAITIADDFVKRYIRKKLNWRPK